MTEMNLTERSLAELLGESAYHDYVYSYPHKTSYRALDPPADLGEVWAEEDTSALSLYLHVPFCEMRCGFCNLFTAVDRRRDEGRTYLEALGRQAEVVASLLPGARFETVAIGGGTPTLLEPRDLETLLGIATDVMGADLGRVPVSVETSPKTATPDRLGILAAAGVDRISIGVQSFDPRLTDELKRPQDPDELRRALGAIRGAGFGTFNIDLMYGVPGQTPEGLVADIHRAISEGANELFLYPLYVRELTPLGMRSRTPKGRRAAYDAASAALGERGWTQRSMRRFTAPDHVSPGTEHRCQSDGMVGLGVGARSYTRGLHYSSEYAVGQRAIRGIIAAYCETPNEEFRSAHHGVRLPTDEQRRRFAILSLLDGHLSPVDYRAEFSRELAADFPQLGELAPPGLAVEGGDGSWRLTAAGRGASDTIGHWLFSPRTRARMAEYEAR